MTKYPLCYGEGFADLMHIVKQWVADVDSAASIAQNLPSAKPVIAALTELSGEPEPKQLTFDEHLRLLVHQIVDDELQKKQIRLY